MARAPLRLLTEVDIINFFKFCSLQTNYLVLQLAHQITSQFMKLHLPKVLLCSLMAVFVSPAMGLSASDIKSKDGLDYLEVGKGSLWSLSWPTETWKGDLTVGDIVENEEVVHGNADKVGHFSDWKFEIPDGNGSDKYTNSLQVTGTLTVQGSGEVLLGGQPKKPLSGNKDNYQGLYAKAIVVTGGSLTSTVITTESLTVSGGTVKTHTGNCSSGSAYDTGYAGPKQSYVNDKITLSGGTLEFGYAGNSVQGVGTFAENGNVAHKMSMFGDSADFEIEQTGGNMKVWGNTNIYSGAKITQSDKAQAMVFRDLVEMTKSGTTEIDQSGDSAKLVFGLLYGKEQNTFDITQSGAGTIHLAYGSNFEKASVIKFTQEGEGTITIGGGHDTTVTGNLPTSFKNISDAGFKSVNTTYEIDQSKSAGLVDIKSDADIIASNVTVGSQAELTAHNLTVTTSLTNAGDFSASGKLNVSGTVANNKNMDVKALEITGGTTTNAEGATLTAGSITVNGGTFVNYGNITSAKPSMLMTAEAEALAEANQVGLITIAKGEMKQYGTTTSNILVQDGGTLTLGVVDNQTVTTAVGAVTLEAGANMVVADDSETGALTLKGGTITFMEGATLTSDSVSGLKEVTIILNLSADTFADVVDGNGYAETLFTVAGTYALNNTTISVATEGKDAQLVQVKQDSNGNVTVGQLVPEPTTATLSLLALAALAARRRRK